MKKISVAILAAAGLALAACGDKAEEEKIVNVYNWSDYIDEEILSEFEAETGIKVVYDVFDSNDVLETKLLAGGSGYDVVVPSGGFLGRQIQAGVFQPLDRSKLTNWGNLWDVILDRTSVFDPDNKYAVTYMWGTTGIGYNVNMVKERMADAPTNSWDMVFNPEIAAKFADCGIYMLDTSDEMIPAALNYIGEDPNSKDPQVIAKAEAVLMGLRPYVRKFHSSEYIDALANGDACVAVGWSGDILQARDRATEADNGVEINYVAPDEGAQMWFDMMAIPADAAHANNAHTFINYIMRPDVMAKASNYVYYANGNKASQPMLNEDVINDPAIYPTPTALKSLFIVTPYDPDSQRALTRQWTRVKSGQ